MRYENKLMWAINWFENCVNIIYPFYSIGRATTETVFLVNDKS